MVTLSFLFYLRDEHPFLPLGDFLFPKPEFHEGKNAME